MLRTALVLTLVFGLCACTPSRGGGGGSEGDPNSTTGGTSYAWVVLSENSDGPSTSHRFMRSNLGNGLCDAVRDYYTVSLAGYEAYAEESAALSDEFAKLADPGSDPEFRRRSCELLVDYYGTFYVGDLYVEGSEVLTLTLGGPNGEPIDGTHVVGEENPLNPDDAPTFHGTFTRYLADYTSLLNMVDCVAYANDPDAELFEELTDTESAEFWTVTGGTLDASAAGDDAWRLTWNEAVMEQDESGEEQPIEVDATFDRCEVDVS